MRNRKSSRLLSTGNTKLGKTANFSIPAIKTCPGRSKECEAVCYACTANYLRSSVQAKYAENLRVTKLKSFPQRMIREIREGRIELVRVHCSGDFYSAEYVDKWIEIARQCRDVTFYAYTRSWRQRDGTLCPWRDRLVSLARQPNFWLWMSCDRETGQPPTWRSARVAYMQVSDDDIPPFPVDLVFRDERKHPVKRVGPHGALICPREQSLPSSRSITCESCRLCFDRDRMLWARDSAVFAIGRSEGRLSEVA